MKTSNFKLSALAPGAVSIARKPPWYFHGRNYPPLFPPEGLLKDYRDRFVSRRDYLDRYFCEVLGPLDAERVVKDINALVAPGEPILLCWEYPQDADLFCHRRIVATWLEGKLNVDVPEVNVADAAFLGAGAGPLFRK